jgi:hypothetical protein
MEAIHTYMQDCVMHGIRVSMGRAGAAHIVSEIFVNVLCQHCRSSYLLRPPYIWKFVTFCFVASPASVHFHRVLVLRYCRMTGTEKEEGFRVLARGSVCHINIQNHYI